MNTTYLFYDIETTGLNHCFDQILQFAAIRTDVKLQELERVNLTVKLNKDVIPAPAAVITHRIGVEQFQQGVAEIDALTTIHRLFNTPGTISLGYNTLGFDDEFLRFSFYRNLLPPYTHQFANHCSRMDLYPITIMFYLFKPQVLSCWPRVNEKISLKLANISAANQLAQGQAHTAMVDVEATLALARKFMQEPPMWKYLSGYFNKNIDIQRQQQLTQGEALLICGKFGANQNFLAPVLHLGPHDYYKNQNLWLRLDTENLSGVSEDNLHDKIFVLRKKHGEAEILLPMKSDYMHLLSESRLRLYQENKRWLRENSHLFQSLCRHYRSYTYPKVPHCDADAALYDVGFPSDNEEKLFQQFHRALPEKKWQIAEKITHPIRNLQALRIMGRHFFDFLPDSKQEIFKKYLEKSLFSASEQAPLDYRNQRKLTIPAALHELKSLQTAESNPELIILLSNLNDFFNNHRFSQKFS